MISLEFHQESHLTDSSKKFATTRTKYLRETELSKTDEGGKAVHELCYVRRTIFEFRKPIDELHQSWAITPIDAEPTASEPVLAGMHWKVFGLMRL